MSNNRYWWDSYGPFDPDPEDENFPNAGQVVRHYRLLKKWTPAELGEAMGKTARWVQAMEHDNNVSESISRRRALAQMLAIPPVLLGLASIESASGTPQLQATPSKKVSIDTPTTEQYQGVLRLYWELDYTSTAQEALLDIRRWIRHLQNIAPNAGSNRPFVLELLCRYHQLATWIARDQCDYETAFAHANRAIKLAESTGNNELMAAALFRRGRTSLEQGNFTSAATDLKAALPYAQHARSQLKGLVLLAAGHAIAHNAQTLTDITQSQTLIEQASRIVRRGNLEDDESFVKLNTGRYHIDKAGALIVIGKPSDALDELYLAERGISPDQTRRHAYIQVLQAQAYTKMGELTIATTTAQEALEISKAIKSIVNIDRINEIYDELSSSKHGNSPQVARLGHLLRSR